MTNATDQGGRRLSMSAFGALIALRRYLTSYRGVDPTEAAGALKRSDADLSASDFDAALELHTTLPMQISFDAADIGIRDSLTFLIETTRPWWRSYFPLGRQRLASALSTNEMQCFSAAGLFVTPPTLAVVAWWDRFAALVRAEEDAQLSDQGREAEILSLEFERARLKALAIDAEPIWSSIESNSLGYDIRSYDLGPVAPVSRLIEVKSTKAIPPRVVLTRGEWEAAETYGDAFYFYIWLLRTQELVIWTVADMGNHIPKDEGAGQWQRLDILV